MTVTVRWSAGTTFTFTPTTPVGTPFSQTVSLFTIPPTPTASINAVLVVLFAAHDPCTSTQYDADPNTATPFTFNGDPNLGDSGSIIKDMGWPAPGNPGPNLGEQWDGLMVFVSFDSAIVAGETVSVTIQGQFDHASEAVFGSCVAAVIDSDDAFVLNGAPFHPVISSGWVWGPGSINPTEPITAQTNTVSTDGNPADYSPIFGAGQGPNAFGAWFGYAGGVATAAPGALPSLSSSDGGSAVIQGRLISRAWTEIALYTPPAVPSYDQTVVFPAGCELQGFGPTSGTLARTKGRSYGTIIG